MCIARKKRRTSERRRYDGLTFGNDIVSGKRSEGARKIVRDA
jgi:hypothetical protein